MTSDLPHRTYAEMMSLVEELDEALRQETDPGVMYSLYVVGGVAMGAVFGSRVTQDVEVATEQIAQEVLSAAETVAARHNLPSSWINNQAAEVIDIDLPIEAFDVLYAGECLLVRGAKPEYLLAMKLMSGRGKDLQDILDLAEATGIDTAEALADLCDEVYAHTASYSLERTWVESVAADVASLLRKKRSGKNMADPTRRLTEEYEGVPPSGIDRSDSDEEIEWMEDR